MILKEVMQLLDVLMCVLLVVIVMQNFFLIWNVFGFRFFTSNKNTPDEEEENIMYFNSISEHVLEREAEFEERIARIKGELALSNITEHKPSHALELHPNVKNLPHNSVNGLINRSGIEYAE